MWNPTVVWLHAVSDGLIGLASFTIPITLRSLARWRPDLPFPWMFFLFGSFIIACGSTDLLEVWNLWHADYWIAGALNAVTAVASLAPPYFSFPSSRASPSSQGLREIARKTLATLGYKVLIVTDGEQALHELQTRGPQIDLALLDVVLSKVSGPEVYTCICSDNQGFPVIFATGYSEEMSQLHEVQRQGLPILLEPPPRPGPQSPRSPRPAPPRLPRLSNN